MASYCNASTWSKYFAIVFQIFLAMSQQCVNSFMDNLEDLIKDSEFSAANFTVNEESFRRLQLFANYAIHGK